MWNDNLRQPLTQGVRASPLEQVLMAQQTFQPVRPVAKMPPTAKVLLQNDGWTRHARQQVVAIHIHQWAVRLTHRTVHQVFRYSWSMHVDQPTMALTRYNIHISVLETYSLWTDYLNSSWCRNRRWISWCNKTRISMHIKVMARATHRNLTHMCKAEDSNNLYTCRCLLLTHTVSLSSIPTIFWNKLQKCLLPAQRQLDNGNNDKNGVFTSRFHELFFSPGCLSFKKAL